jgi:hypothetical protein
MPNMQATDVRNLVVEADIIASLGTAAGAASCGNSNSPLTLPLELPLVLAEVEVDALWS